MPNYIDLTVPIQPHFRWGMERGLTSDYAKGDSFQTTWIKLIVHGYTHIDSPRHMVQDGKTSSEVPLSTTIGEASVIDLSDIEPNQEITANMLQARGDHVQKGDIVLLKTCWDLKRDLNSEAFWTDAPYLSRGACEWLLSTGLKAFAPDFPQDYPIRKLLHGEVAPIEEFVSHDVLLRNGVILIEYVGNFDALKSPRTFIYALPIRIPESDGCPARVIAVE
ncbi:cyclase family protein [Roseibium sp. CAU 1637]|uniref:Cyclase family protein n=1 Tax=Roseibium limicola TaxID=2816037 RepID=A0A939JAL2_9HYPH|nr:cyclase family protein [Roseibium limicola]MBO0347049.1 cyclase family protein [Roseibium limicola]